MMRALVILLAASGGMVFAAGVRSLVQHDYLEAVARGVLAIISYTTALEGLHRIKAGES